MPLLGSELRCTTATGDAKHRYKNEHEQWPATKFKNTLSASQAALIGLYRPQFLLHKLRPWIFNIGSTLFYPTSWPTSALQIVSPLPRFAQLGGNSHYFSLKSWS